MRGQLLIFCGIPGSGKTTVARLVVGRLKDGMLIQTDDFRGMISRPNFSRDESRFVYDAAIAVAREAFARGYSVILDATFMREEYRQLARRELRGHYRKVDVIHVTCSLATALKRNSGRAAEVPREKVVAMFKGFEEPRRSVRVDTSKTRPEAAARRVIQAVSRTQSRGRP